jgi:hypothetical protein
MRNAQIKCTGWVRGHVMPFAYPRCGCAGDVGAGDKRLEELLGKGLQEARQQTEALRGA